MAIAVIVLAVATLVLGLALGWYLREKERWCSRCGGHLSCRTCGEPARGNR